MIEFFCLVLIFLLLLDHSWHTDCKTSVKGILNQLEFSRKWLWDQGNPLKCNQVPFLFNDSTFSCMLCLHAAVQGPGTFTHICAKMVLSEPPYAPVSITEEPASHCRWGYRKISRRSFPLGPITALGVHGGPLWPGQVRSPRPLLFSHEALLPTDSWGGGMERNHGPYPFPFSLIFLRKNLLYKKERDRHVLPFPHQLSHCIMTPLISLHLSTCRGSSREVLGKRFKGLNFTICIL